MKPEIIQYIKDHFTYNPETGVIDRDDRKNSLGCLDGDGYLTIKVKGHRYKAHRIAWILYYGYEPQAMLDHINRCKTDNRISNLRLADYFINNNNANRKVNPDTGVVGVHITKLPQLNKKFAVRRNKHTYRFYTLEQAVEFRNQCINNILYGEKSLSKNP